MQIWKLLLITLLGAVALGCVVGIVGGKQMAKRARGEYRPLLSSKERLLYGLSIVAGLACITLALFVLPNRPVGMDEFSGNPLEQNGTVDGGVFEEQFPDVAVNENENEMEQEQAISDSTESIDAPQDSNPMTNQEEAPPTVVHSEIGVARAVG